MCSCVLCSVPTLLPHSAHGVCSTPRAQSDVTGRDLPTLPIPPISLVLVPRSHVVPCAPALPTPPVSLGACSQLTCGCGLRFSGLPLTLSPACEHVTALSCLLHQVCPGLAMDSGAPTARPVPSDFVPKNPLFVQLCRALEADASLLASAPLPLLYLGFCGSAAHRPRGALLGAGMGVSALFLPSDALGQICEKDMTPSAGAAPVTRHGVRHCWQVTAFES